MGIVMDSSSAAEGDQKEDDEEAPAKSDEAAPKKAPSPAVVPSSGRAARASVEQSAAFAYGAKQVRTPEASETTFWQYETGHAGFESYESKNQVIIESTYQNYVKREEMYGNASSRMEVTNLGVVISMDFKLMTQRVYNSSGFAGKTRKIRRMTKE